MIVSEGALDWPMIDAGLAELPAISTEQIEQATQMATDLLWALSGRRFGTRAVLDRPASQQPTYYLREIPSFLMSIWGYNRGWPYDSDPRTGQLSVRQIIELQRDVISVESINIYPGPNVTDPFLPDGGGLLPQANWRFEGNWLVRQDGGGWPQTQNLIAEFGQPDTWQIAYTRGVTPPMQGQRAAGLLALEFGKFILGIKGCKLPLNVTTVTRSGVTITRDILAAIKTTGISEVDQWVGITNPNSLQSPPRIWSPDVARNSPPYMGSYQGGSSTRLP